MSNTCRSLLHFLLAILLLTHLIAASPLLVVRRVPSPYLQTMEQLERLINEEQSARESLILRRHRKSIPDGYFNEFSVAADVLDRQRRGQPISDYTDEFSADPFEISVSNALAEKTAKAVTTFRR
uniref:Uncharacterized protein n=1 Tax=Caenorhabditis japonica TaxID=281687 RepID=A0A8R1I7Z8_CAEJA